MYAHLRMVNLLSEAVYGEGGEGPVPDAGHVTVQSDGLRLWQRCNQKQPKLPKISTCIEDNCNPLVDLPLINRIPKKWEIATLPLFLLKILYMQPFFSCIPRWREGRVDDVTSNWKCTIVQNTSPLPSLMQIRKDPTPQIAWPESNQQPTWWQAAVLPT